MPATSSVEQPELNAAPAEKLAVTALQLGGIATAFAKITRAPRYTPERQENNAEHSFMLALIATELAAQIRPDLNPSLVSQFAMVHDLPELGIGDTPTFTLSEAELANKRAREHKNLRELLPQLPPYTAELVVRYEAQEEPEVRFVCLIDKLVTLIANIHGEGEVVMREAFGITTIEELRTVDDSFAQRLRSLFPEAELESLHHVRAIIAALFEQKFATTTTR